LVHSGGEAVAVAGGVQVAATVAHGGSAQGSRLWGSGRARSRRPGEISPRRLAHAPRGWGRSVVRSLQGVRGCAGAASVGEYDGADGRPGHERGAVST